jgi:regulator of RNase E activity RraA
MKSGKNRVRMRSVGEPVQMGGTRVDMGDVVCADDSGVVVVPRRHLDEVAEGVRQVAEMERRIRADLASGMSLQKARGRHGYDRTALRRAD